MPTTKHRWTDFKVIVLCSFQKWLETINAHSAPRCEVCRYRIHTRKSYRVSLLQIGLEPSTSYSIHFFTRSVSSFRNTRPYHRNLFCCSINIISSIPSLSLSSLLGALSTLTWHIRVVEVKWINRFSTTTTTTVLWPFVWDYLGEPVPEETLTHPPSWSSSSLYQLLPSTTIHSNSILLVQITCLAIFLHNLFADSHVTNTLCVLSS